MNSSNSSGTPVPEQVASYYSSLVGDTHETIPAQGWVPLPGNEVESCNHTCAEPRRDAVSEAISAFPADNHARLFARTPGSCPLNQRQSQV